jgi:hypothetical protein
LRVRNPSPVDPSLGTVSRITRGRRELIDQFLVSQALVSPLTAVTARAAIDVPLASIDPTDPLTRRNEPSSDHAPVVATFTNL